MEDSICLHILADNATTLNRVLKEADCFIRNRAAGQVVLLAKWDAGLAERQELAPGICVRRIRLATRFLPRRLPWQILKEMEWRRRVVRNAREIRPRLIFCHSVMPLRAAVQSKRATGAPLVYDAHELETERIDIVGAKRRVFSFFERRLIHHCDAVLCVSDSIADWYARHYGIPRPAVVRNIPDQRSSVQSTRSNALRERFGLAPDQLVFIYQGALIPGRRVEELAQVFARARPDRHLVFMGFGPLEKAVLEAAAAHPNVHFLPAVPLREMLNYTASADIGFAAHLEPACLNHRYALPNKFFEYLLAGLPIWVNDVHEEMAALVRKHGFGWVTPYAEEGMTQWVNSVDRAELQAKRKLAAEAGTLFSWRKEEAVLLERCRQILV
jgi:glycosyltransferase involved in cell wall biosynthesis